MSQFKNGTDYIGSELLHTPGGVRDTYGVECENKLDVAGKVHDVMKSYGFDDIQTPTFEYFDIFSKERGTASSKEMFKFFDRGNNTLVLRPEYDTSDCKDAWLNIIGKSRCRFVFAILQTHL